MSAAKTWRSNTALRTAKATVCLCWRPTWSGVRSRCSWRTPPLRTFAAKAATATIPIVFVTGVDPVEVGLVASFNRPGANVTGVTFLSNKLVAKRLELLATLVSGAAPIGMLAHTRNPNTVADVRDALATAAALGRTLHVERVASASDLDAAVAALVQQRVAGLFVAPQADFRLWRQPILALAQRHALPTSFSNNDFVVAGGLMGYGPHQVDSYREAGTYTGRILKGTKPADLPVLVSTTFDFAINLKTAKALGLTIPPTMLALATEVIEGWMAPLRHLSAKLLSDRISSEWEPSMGEVTTIGLDLAKHVFQVHGVDAEGAMVLRKQLRRAQVLAFFSRLPSCLVGLEACATAHYWGRELRALGHEVRLMPAQYVKAYIKRNKHDAADAEAICEAVVRPTMRFVPVKTADQQAAVLLHRGRERLVRQRTGLVNALRGHLAEFGVIAPQGLRNVGELIAIVRDERDARLPDLARQVLQVLAAQIEQLEAAVAAVEKQLMAWHKSNPVSQRLASVPGIGPIIATAIAATVVEPSGFRSGREFAAWLGLVPRQNSTGGKPRLGRISKRGNQYLRRLLINGASANLLRSKATKADPWVIGIRSRRPPLVVAVALANKTARIAWAVMLRQEQYQARAVAA
jgi:transposase